jgi:hypothetical protein
MGKSQSPLSPAERLILTNLGGCRWTVRRYRRPGTVRAAKRAWGQVRQAVGFTKTTGWMTTDQSNPKMAKNGVPSAGLTLHAATNAVQAWSSITAAEQAALASSVGVTIDDIDDGLKRSVCPRSTPSCREACVAARSANGKLERSQRVRLARHLFMLFRPADALALTADALDKLTQRYGRRGARWRVNISDDIRWERIAPGLFAVAPRAYTYTKWSPVERPGRPGLSIVYSASEHMTADQVVSMCANQHRVAVIFDLPKSKDLPETWHGVRVVDGDKTDDLYKHPAGSIVGLRAKGNLKERAFIRQRGFAREAVPDTTAITVVPLPTRTTRSIAVAA